MRIAIPVVGKDLDSAIAPTFGRAPGFLIVDISGSEIQSFNYLANPGASSWRGAGIAAAQAVVNAGVNVVLAPSVGPNSFGVLSNAGVKMYVATGTVKDAIDKFLSNSLTELNAPQGQGFGRGLGRGRGFGRRFFGW